MNESILYLECFSGISGDMTVAALLDLGVDEGALRTALSSLPLDGYHIAVSRTTKCGIDACSFDVILENDIESAVTSSPSEPHTHDHSHHDHSHHDHSHHDHSHHDHSHHDHSHHDLSHHDHPHRNIYDVYQIINQGNFHDSIKEMAKTMFDYVARAESKAHGLPVAQVHFHEVGAVDSIVDIVAVAFCIHALQITKVCVSTVYEGQGFVRCQHGVIPVPVPAVVNIASERGIALRITENRGEMVTPTGMAIVAALKTEEQLPDSYIIKQVGLGGGKKDFKQANIVRAMVIEPTTSPKDSCVLLETNVDDCTGEALGFVLEELLEHGANDVFFTPIFMKKNRPATTVSVLCHQDRMEACESILFRHLSTIGIRRFPCKRTVLPRMTQKIKTTYGEVTFKICSYQGEHFGYPEFEDVKRICKTQQLPFDETYARIKTQYVPL